MNCPICGNPLRPSKKDPAYGLCDNCRKKFRLKKETASTASSASTTEKSIDSKPKKSKKKLAIFFLFFFLLVVLAGFAYFFFGKKTDSNKPSASSEQTEVTDSVEQNTKNAALYEETFQDITISLTNTSESNGNDLSSPSDGNVFYICEFQVVNNSTKDIAINSLSDLEAYCGDYSVSEDISGLLLPETEGKNSLDGTIAAGQTFTGVVTYQIPEDYNQMQFRLAPDFWGNDTATFTVPKE